MEQFRNGYIRIIDNEVKEHMKNLSNIAVEKSCLSDPIRKHAKQNEEKRFQKFHAPNLLFRCDRLGDRYEIFNSGKIIEIEHFLECDEGKFVVGKLLRRRKSFYTHPCLSEQVGIYMVDQLSVDSHRFPLSMLKNKCYPMPFEDQLIMTKLMHH